MASEADRCLSDDAVLALVEQRLDEADATAVHRHLAQCQACRKLLAAACALLVDAPPGERSVHVPDRRTDAEDPMPTLLPPGAMVSRYRIDRLIGGGTGGLVYRAEDPQLGRPVALKMALRGPRDDGRFVREERALAQVSHPNVVNVFDAGLHDGYPFVVMELVTGVTLASWLRGRPRSWREVLSVFIGACRGLAAAHEAGLVHGDFKPDNVIVDEQGRARVADFGLARSAREATVPEPGSGAASPGALSGTLLYMAPELFDGQPATASSDQFSFCVALFQALQGAHPYLDPTLSAPRLDDLIAATKAGALRAGPRDAALPAGLRRALRRGLAHEAGRRYPSLRALLQDLEACLEGERPAVGPVRRRRALTAAAAVVLLPAAFVAARALLRPAAIAGPRCGDGVVDRGEECDDGNADDADGCTIGCLRCAGGDDRFSASDGHCYSRHAAVASWSDAQASCTRIGGHLVAYHDAAEIAAVSERLVAGRGDSFWIGLSDVAGTGAFAWVTGDALDPSLGWVERHAQGACVWQSGRARIGAQALTWIPADCSKRLAYVCEQDGHFKAF